MHLVRYREAQDLADGDAGQSCRAISSPTLRRARRDRRRCARGRAAPGSIRSRSNGLLARYDIPVDAGRPSPRRRRRPRPPRGPILAEGGPVAVKILSPDIVHKSDVGGVRLDLTSDDGGARGRRRSSSSGPGALKPGARVTGVTVQPMVRRPKARELIAGLADDPTFGPVVVFGRGGTAVEVINDKALALPPLDLEARPRPDRAHAGVAHPQGLPRRAGRGRATRSALVLVKLAAARRRPAGGARARHQPASSPTRTA